MIGIGAVAAPVTFAVAEKVASPVTGGARFSRFLVFDSDSNQFRVSISAKNSSGTDFVVSNVVKNSSSTNFILV